MNLFDIDIHEKMFALLKEAFKFKKYKAMHPCLAVFTGILMLPFVAMSFLATALLAILCFTFSVFASPIKFLHNMVSNEGKDVKHGTQIVVYLISWPTIFLFYVMVSALLLFIIPVYALTSILYYVWTLGGFKFHVLINKADDISIEVNGKYFGRPLAYVICGALIIFLVPLIHNVALFADLFARGYGNYFPIFFIANYVVYLGVHIGFSALYSLIAFSLAPSKKVAAPVAEAVVAAPAAEVAAPITEAAEITDVIE